MAGGDRLSFNERLDKVAKGAYADGVRDTENRLLTEDEIANLPPHEGQHWFEGCMGCERQLMLAQGAVSYAAGVADTEAKYAALVEAVVAARLLLNRVWQR